MYFTKRQKRTNECLNFGLVMLDQLFLTQSLQITTLNVHQKALATGYH